MFKIISALIPFIKELFFDHKDEANFTSARFNAKKWLGFALFILSLVMLSFETQRLVSMSLDFVKLQEENKLLTKKQQDFQIQIAAGSKETTLLQQEIISLRNECGRPVLHPHLNSKLKIKEREH